MSDVVVGTLLAVLIFLLGLWARRNLANLVPQSLSPYRREKKELELRRGAYALMGFAVFIAIGVVARIVFTLLH
jgi:hypothetical protein